MAAVKIPDEGLQVYQLKINLDALDLPVWRRVLVSNIDTLRDLHLVIQGVFGWGNYHLHHFITPEGEFAAPELEEYLAEEPDVKDASKVFLHQLFSKKGHGIQYIYDFGDEWVHDIVFEKKEVPVPGEKYPSVIAGANAAPPEDSGGPGGYSAILEAMGKKKKTEEEREALEWLGRGFSPKYFSLEKCSKRLAKYARPQILVHAKRAKKLKE